jgi:hypothetical protein
MSMVDPKISADSLPRAALPSGSCCPPWGGGAPVAGPGRWWRQRSAVQRGFMQNLHRSKPTGEISSGRRETCGHLQQLTALLPFGSCPQTTRPRTASTGSGITWCSGHRSRPSRACKGLIAPGRKPTHQSAMGAGAEKRTSPGVPGLGLIALVGSDRLLHLINDQHHIAAALNQPPP